MQGLTIQDGGGDKWGWGWGEKGVCGGVERGGGRDTVQYKERFQILILNFYLQNKMTSLYPALFDRTKFF